MPRLLSNIRDFDAVGLDTGVHQGFEQRWTKSREVGELPRLGSWARRYVGDQRWPYWRLLFAAGWSSGIRAFARAGTAAVGHGGLLDFRAGYSC